MNIKAAITLVIIFWVFIGCHRRQFSQREITARTLADQHAITIYSHKTKTEYIIIEKVINSSCACADVIAEKYVYNRLVYRFYYGCSIYKSRKVLYFYCSQGALVGPASFEASETEGSDFETKLSPLDEFVLHKIDSFIPVDNVKNERLRLCEKDIRGFKISEL